MLQRDLAPDSKGERQQLLILAAGLGVVASALIAFFGLGVWPCLLGGLALVALVGAAAHRWCGRDVYLGFALVALAVGGVVSRLLLVALYLVGILLLGSILKLFRMNQLNRDFQACRAMKTIFVDAPATSLESFGRQS